MPLLALPDQSRSVCKLTLSFRSRTPQGTLDASLLPTQAAVAKIAKIVSLLGLAQAIAEAAGRELELSHRPPTARWKLLWTQSASPRRVQTRKVVAAMGTTRERH